MGRFRNCLLTTFRVCQFLFSLIALACGAYITYKMYDLAGLAEDLQLALSSAIGSTSSISATGKALKTLSNGLDPVLTYLQSTPVRAISLTVVSFVSTIIIVYLFFARRSKNHPGADRQSIRVTLEILILLAWLGGITCAVLLALQYGTLAMSGGLAVKAAMKVARSVLEKKLSDIAKDKPSMKNALDALDMFGDLVTIAAMAIASVLAAAICLKASFISLIVACCSKSRKKDLEHGEHGRPTSVAEPLNPKYVDKSPTTTYTEKTSRTTYNAVPSSTSYISEPTAPWQSAQPHESPYQQKYQSPVQKTYQSPQSSQTWSPPPPQTWQPLSSQKWHPAVDSRSAPVPFTAPTPYTGKPTPYMAFTSSQQEPYHYSDNNQYYSRHVSGADQWGR